MNKYIGLKKIIFLSCFFLFSYGFIIASHATTQQNEMKSIIDLFPDKKLAEAIQKHLKKTKCN